MRKVRQSLILTLTLICTIASAQIGFKGGLNFNSAETDFNNEIINNLSTSYRSKVFGLVGEIGINDRLSFQPELQYIKKGFAIGGTIPYGLFGIDIPIGAKVIANLDYVELPLLLKIPISTNNFTGYAIAGPSIGYAMGARLEPKITVLIDWDITEIDLNISDDRYNRTDIGGIIGGGIEKSLENGKLFGDLRYQYSFTNVMSNPIDDISVRNRGIQLSMGYIHQF